MNDGAPSRRRKTAFWLLAGMLSVVCVEVPAGSTMFPFFTLWGLLVVWPLYMLHSVFLAALFPAWQTWLLAALRRGHAHGMYEAYITKVVWTSFRPEGPFFAAGGIALFETIICVLFLHPLLAFVIPLLLTELLLTNSTEVLLGLPPRSLRSIRAHPAAWDGRAHGDVWPDAVRQLLLGNELIPVRRRQWHGHRLGRAVVAAIRRHRVFLARLASRTQGLKASASVLLARYLLWGFAIKPKSIPLILHGQLTVWVLYAALLWIFHRCLLRSRRVPSGAAQEAAVGFSWRGFLPLLHPRQWRLPPRRGYGSTSLWARK